MGPIISALIVMDGNPGHHVHIAEGDDESVRVPAELGDAGILDESRFSGNLHENIAQALSEAGRPAAHIGAGDDRR